MEHCTWSRTAHQIDLIRSSFAQSRVLPFADLLSVEELAATVDHRAEGDDPVYSLPITLWMFLGQIFDRDHSCRQAVSRLLAWRTATGQAACSANNGAYCKARQRLRESDLHRLVQHTGRGLHGKAVSAWKWQGRNVKIADGTTVTMPDTPANQRAYPQPDGQEPGLGFPMMRLVVLLCLTTAAVLEAALNPYCGKGTGELSMLRRIWHHLDAGDVLLSDCIYCSYFEIAMLQGRGVDVVMNKHQSRPTDFRTGRRLGAKDHIVTWTKPRQCPEWLERAAYDVLADELLLREVEITVEQAGFRSKKILVVTTILEMAAASRQEIARLYRQRWHAELDIRSIKQAMQMSELRCKTPEMVRKELWVHLLAYNLIRGLMVQAAFQHGLLPRQISFTGTLQALNAFTPHLPTAQLMRDRLLQDLLAVIAAHRVADRPDRIEPRARKRRNKKYPALSQPRAQARALLKG